MTIGMADRSIIEADGAARYRGFSPIVERATRAADAAAQHHQAGFGLAEYVKGGNFSRGASSHGREVSAEASTTSIGVA